MRDDERLIHIEHGAARTGLQCLACGEPAAFEFDLYAFLPDNYLRVASHRYCVLCDADELAALRDRNADGDDEQ